MTRLRAKSTRRHRKRKKAFFRKRPFSGKESFARPQFIGAGPSMNDPFDVAAVVGAVNALFTRRSGAR